MKKLAILFLLIAMPALAANKFVTPAGAGGQTGNDWTNALPGSFTPVRGNDYYLADGAYGAGKTLSTAVSGATVISIKKCTTTDGVSSAAAGYVSTLCDGQATWSGGFTFDTSYWTVDGVTGGGPSDWACANCGFVVITTKTNCNDTGGWFTFGNNVTDVTVMHTEAYQTPFVAEGSSYTGYFISAKQGTNTRLRFAYNAFHHSFGGSIHTQNMNDSTFEYNYLAKVRSTGTPDPHGFCNDAHGELFSNIGTDNRDIVRYNLTDMITGTAIFAQINGGKRADWQVYGNIFTRSDTMIYASEDAGTPVSNFLFYNNVITFSDASQLFLCVSCTGRAYNNIVYKNTNNATTFGSLTHDYNYASDNIRTEGCTPACDKDAELLSGEAHGVSVTGSPFVNATASADPLTQNFHLRAATAAGCSTLAMCGFTPNNTDMYGNTRGADGVWARGAIEFSAGTSNALPPPTSLSVTVH